jgi:FAD/FMN-containing dehydrogenase
MRSLAVVDADAPVRRKPTATRSKKRARKKTATKKAARPKRRATKTVKATNKPASRAVRTQSTRPKKAAVVAAVKREPLGHLLVEHKLRDAGFRGVVSSDKSLLEEYATDESIFNIKPQIVLQPKDQRDIEIAVKTLGAETGRFPSLSLTPRAAGTGLSGGSLTDSVVLDIAAHLTGINEPVTKGDGTTITCEPGAMWRDVEAQLKTVDCYLPPFPASKDICTIGGAIANNAAGPDSLRHGHMADWVASLDVTFHDGKTYTVKPLSYKELRALTKKKHAYATIAKEVFDLIVKHEETVTKAKPKTAKNSAGYPLWDVVSPSVKAFKRGVGTFDLTRLISGSQGTIGVVVRATLRAQPIAHDTSLIVIPVFNLADASSVVVEALQYDPINVEIFDGLTYDLALKNPDFFKDRISRVRYYQTLLSMYTTYHVRYGRRTPDFTLLVTLDTRDMGVVREALAAIRESGGARARLITNDTEKEMFWQIRRASYTLSKLKDTSRRPAAFLEDMTVPPENLGQFFAAIKKLLKKYKIDAAVHGHGGNGHFHFYPLLDFTSPATPPLIEKMAEEFFTTAIKFQGNICGEHNDGIIRTPHLNKMFNKKTLDLFAAVEHIFDPQDIFNPGKKVNPRFDIKESVRKTN